MSAPEKLVTSKARKAVQGFLEQVTADDVSLCDIVAWPAELVALGEELLPAFIEAAATHDESCARLVASWAILLAVDSGEEEVSEQVVLMARQQMVAGLR